MIHRGMVVLGLLAAAGLAYATAEWEHPTPLRARTGRNVVRRLPGAPEPVPEAGAPVPGETPAAAAPEAPVAPVAPPKPAPPAIELKEVTDVKLPVAEHAQRPTFQRSNEIHVTADESMTWHAGGQAKEVESFSGLQKGLLQRSTNPVVVVADPLTGWRQVRLIFESAQKAGITDTYVGAATPDEPTMLRVLAMPQPYSADEPMPEGDVFRIEVSDGDKDPYVANGKVLDGFPADLALAWNEWRAAHLGTSDTASVAATHVVLDIDLGASLQRVVTLVDVLRGIGVHAERLPPLEGRKPR